MHIYWKSPHTSIKYQNPIAQAPTIHSNNLSIPAQDSDRLDNSHSNELFETSSILSFIAMSDNTSTSGVPLTGNNNAVKVDINRSNNGIGTKFNQPGRNNGGLVQVQPPRREDLQPSYAQTLVGESDQGTHGWYGAMSTHLPLTQLYSRAATNIPQSMDSVPASVP